jgi:hypothetical protein
MSSTILLFAVYVSVAAAWTYGIASLILTCRNRQFWRSHSRQAPPILVEYPKICLIVPCKGMEHRLRENLTAYVHQDHPNFELQFVVESEDDSAVNLIRNIMRENRHVPSRLVVAGRATHCGQKVHNLRCATDQLAGDIEVLVFADSNLCPQPSWLKWLATGIENENVVAKTGYRWMVPLDKSFPTLLGCTINNTCAALFGRGTRFLVWGGNWAIHREVFNAVGIRDAWDGTLSDDLVASRVLFYSHLPVQFEPQSVCVSHVKFTTMTLFAFLRRQFVVARRYTSTYWLVALWGALLTQAGYWSALIVGCVAISRGSPTGLWLLGSSTLLFLLGIGKALIRQNMGRIVTSEWRKYRRARKFDIAAGPMTGLFATLVMVCSAFGNQISWRGIRYYISRGGRVVFLGRNLVSEAGPIASGPRMYLRRETPVEPSNRDFVQERDVVQKRAA